MLRSLNQVEATLQWQPQGRIVLHDTQVGPPIYACTHLLICSCRCDFH
jgi:hypothetical protein